MPAHRRRALIGHHRGAFSRVATFWVAWLSLRRRWTPLQLRQRSLKPLPSPSSSFPLLLPPDAVVVPLSAGACHRRRSPSGKFVLPVASPHSCASARPTRATSRHLVWPRTPLPPRARRHGRRAPPQRGRAVPEHLFLCRSLF